jgi:DNA-binding transcriptional regulator YiaG
MNLPELGYTPANLRALLKHAGLTQQAAAEMLNVDARSVRKWCAPLESDHADMPHHRWVKLLSIVREVSDEVGSETTA